MSGVFGIASWKSEIDLESVTRQMAASMRHEAWYVIEQMIDLQAQVVLGRVGIGIFNRGSQPVWNADQSVALAWAGEIYSVDGKERSQIPAADELILLDLYARRGDGLAGSLEGSFVIAIWDRLRGQILITNDRWGHYPLYYTHEHGKFLFAPEMKALLADPAFHKQLDQRALAEYMRFQLFLSDRTFFEGVKLLPNASKLCYDVREDRLEIEPYWDLSKGTNQRKINFNEAVEEGGRLLKAAVQKRTGGEAQLGVFLSGGMDSRVILGFIDRQYFPLSTVTYGIRNSRDFIYAASLAKKAGTQHHTFVFNGGSWVPEYAQRHLDLTEGFHSWIHSHGISILEQVRPLMGVNQTGFAGGEYDWEDPLLMNAENDQAYMVRLFGNFIRNTTWPSMDEAEEKLLFSPSYSHLVGVAFDSLREEQARLNHLPYGLRTLTLSRYTVDRRLFMYYAVFYRGYIEMRFPFCDYEYNDFVQSTPPEWHFHRKLRREIIRRQIPAYAGVAYDKDELPINQGLGRLSARLIRRSKSMIHQRFGGLFPQYVSLNSDYENWLRGELKQWAEEILFGESTVRHGIFDQAFLHALWERHLAGREENTLGKLAPIMTYEMVLRRFYD